MQNTNRPRRIIRPFGASAAAGYINNVPDAAQPIGSDGNRPASYTTGFPPETFQPSASGGSKVAGQDVNGVLFDATGNAMAMAAGMPAMYDATYAAAIGGYPMYALVASTTAGTFYQSTVDNNTTNPDAGGSNGWLLVLRAVGKTTQDGQMRQSISAPNTYTVEFPVPFGTACTACVISPYSASASSVRDNWVQLVSSSPTGFTFTVQSSGVGSDQGLDGIDWIARGN